MNEALKVAFQTWAIAAGISMFVATLIVIMTKLLARSGGKKK